MEHWGVSILVTKQNCKLNYIRRPLSISQLEDYVLNLLNIYRCNLRVYWYLILRTHRILLSPQKRLVCTMHSENYIFFPFKPKGILFRTIFILLIMNKAELSLVHDVKEYFRFDLNGVWSHSQHLSCPIPTLPFLHMMQLIADWVAPFPWSRHSPPPLKFFHTPPSPLPSYYYM